MDGVVLPAYQGRADAGWHKQDGRLGLLLQRPKQRLNRCVGVAEQQHLMGALQQGLYLFFGQAYAAQQLYAQSSLRQPVVFLRKQRSEEHTSELQSLMRISYAVFCLKKKNKSYT